MVSIDEIFGKLYKNIWLAPIAGCILVLIESILNLDKTLDAGVGIGISIIVMVFLILTRLNVHGSGIGYRITLFQTSPGRQSPIPRSPRGLGGWCPGRATSPFGRPGSGRRRDASCVRSRDSRRAGSRACPGTCRPDWRSMGGVILSLRVRLGCVRAGSLLGSSTAVRRCPGCLSGYATSRACVGGPRRARTIGPFCLIPAVLAHKAESKYGVESRRLNPVRRVELRHSQKKRARKTRVGLWGVAPGSRISL